MLALRGQDFKRLLRAAAALQGLYEDKDLADAVGVSRGAVQGWWGRTAPKPSTLQRIGTVTGLSAQELIAWFHLGGPRPSWPPDPGSAPDSAVREGIRQDRTRQQREGRPEPQRSPLRPSPGT